MLTDVLKHTLDVLRVRRTRKVGKESLVLGVRVHRVEEGLDEVFGRVRIVVPGWSPSELELWGLKLVREGLMLVREGLMLVREGLNMESVNGHTLSCCFSHWS